MSESERRHLTVMLVPDGSHESRTYRLSFGVIRVLVVLAAVVALALTLMAGSWWYLAARAAHVAELEAEIRSLEVERERIDILARQLVDVEERYERIRALFGRREADVPSDVWLPPASGGRRTRTPRADATASLPSSWPLTERGFVTQELVDAGGESHPGLDIAVSTDSYVRASGAGTVVDAGEDPVYGRFVVIDHGDGYSSLYGHASLRLVERGQRVRRNEVIALSGSTGRSTAPHLHFEILLNGEAVDPLTLVSQP
ncbi:MAG: M23 family metallopeptidase [Longimicrobiales bacterium]